MLNHDIKLARKIALKHQLAILSDWAQNRANGDFNERTTLTVLKRKLVEIEDKVNKAGYAASYKQSL